MCCQANQEISLSWQYPLLLPFCVRPISSPPLIIGTPCERSSGTRKFLCCRARNAFTFASSVGPSAPQFHERLLLSPSGFSSLFASLCFSLHATCWRPV